MVQLSHLYMTTGKTVALTLWAFVDSDVSAVCCVVLSHSVMSNSLQTYGLYPTRLFCPRRFFGQEHGSGCHALLQGIFPTQRIEPRSPPFQAVSLPSEPPRKSKNSGVGSLSLLRGNFPTQESNRGLLNCRWILYQLSYQGCLCYTDQ